MAARAVGSAINHLLILAARALMASIFLISGYGKTAQYGPTLDYIPFMGVLVSVLPAAILFESGAGLALPVGFQTRLAGQ